MYPRVSSIEESLNKYLLNNYACQNDFPQSFLMRLSLLYTKMKKMVPAQGTQRRIGKIMVKNVIIEGYMGVLSELHGGWQTHSG